MCVFVARSHLVNLKVIHLKIKNRVRVASVCVCVCVCVCVLRVHLVWSCFGVVVKEKGPIIS